MTTPPQNQPQYTDFEKEFLTNVYLTSKATDNKYIGIGNYKGISRPDWVETAADVLPESAGRWLKDKFTTERNQNEFFMVFLPQSTLGHGLYADSQQKQLFAAIKKFGGLDPADSGNDTPYSTTMCAINAYSTERVDLKNDNASAKKGMEKIFNTANSYVNTQLTSQEKQILDKVIEQYRSSESSCGISNINGLEGNVIDALAHELMNNNITGGKKMTAEDINNLVANVSKASHLNGLDAREREEHENNLNIVKKVANSFVK